MGRGDIALTPMINEIENNVFKQIGIEQSAIIDALNKLKLMGKTNINNGAL